MDLYSLLDCPLFHKLVLILFISLSICEFTIVQVVLETFLVTYLKFIIHILLCSFQYITTQSLVSFFTALNVSLCFATQ